MTSQSPETSNTVAKQTDPYLEAWQAMSHMVMEQGASWSGREKNCSYLNLGNGKFANVSGSTDADFLDDARAVALLDWDHDGAIDLLLKNRSAPRLRLMRNQAGEGRQWVGLRLKGTGGSNLDAIGASARITTSSGRKLNRTKYAGDAYLSQSSPTLHFGLGSESDEIQVEIKWPDGSVEDFGVVQPGHVYSLIQGSGNPAIIHLPKLDRFAEMKPSPLSVDPSSSRRAVLVDRLPLAALPLPSYSDKERNVHSLAGSPVLINLWGTTCANCFKELKDFKDHASEIADMGLKIIPMSTDEVNLQEKAQKQIALFGFTSDIAGPTQSKWMGALELIFLEIFGPNAPSVLPTSLLLDPNGRLCVVYQGPVSIETLKADVKTIVSSPPDNRFTGVLTGGQWLARRFRDFQGLSGAMTQNGFPQLGDFFHQMAVQTGQVK